MVDKPETVLILFPPDLGLLVTDTIYKGQHQCCCRWVSDAQVSASAFKDPDSAPDEANVLTRFSS